MPDGSLYKAREVIKPAAWGSERSEQQEQGCRGQSQHREQYRAQGRGVLAEDADEIVDLVPELKETLHDRSFAPAGPACP